MGAKLGEGEVSAAGCVSGSGLGPGRAGPCGSSSLSGVSERPRHPARPGGAGGDWVGGGTGVRG